jgi:hypothetical protein
MPQELREQPETVPLETVRILPLLPRHDKPVVLPLDLPEPVVMRTLQMPILVTPTRVLLMEQPDELEMLMARPEELEMPTAQREELEMPMEQREELQLVPLLRSLLLTVAIQES